MSGDSKICPRCGYKMLETPDGGLWCPACDNEEPRKEKESIEREE